MPISKVALISKRAKKIRKKGEPWLSAIKRASKQIGGTLGSSSRRSAGSRRRASVPPKKKAAKKKPRPLHQTGSSNTAIDRKVKAKAPGKRSVSHKGKKKSVYYEYRKNRSDMPGKLTGMKPGTAAYNEMIVSRIRSNNHFLAAAEVQLRGLQDRYKNSPKGMAKSLAKVHVEKQQKYIKSIRDDIRMLSTLLKFSR